MKVEKDKFDTLLQKVLQQNPEKTSAIKSEKKGGKIIPPKTPPPAPHTASAEFPSCGEASRGTSYRVDSLGTKAKSFILLQLERRLSANTLKIKESATKKFAHPTHAYHLKPCFSRAIKIGPRGPYLSAVGRGAVTGEATSISTTTG